MGGACTISAGGNWKPYRSTEGEESEETEEREEGACVCVPVYIFAVSWGVEEEATSLQNHQNQVS